jgi:hypothetical protein
MSHKRTFTWLKEPIEACLCRCHSDPTWRHIVPCCGVTYKQYIIDEKINYEMLDKALEETYNWRKENNALKCQCECHVRPGIMHCVPCCKDSR